MINTKTGEVSIKICPKCGTDYPPDKEVCDYCGIKLDKINMHFDIFKVLNKI